MRVIPSGRLQVSAERLTDDERGWIRQHRDGLALLAAAFPGLEAMPAASRGFRR